MRASTTTRPETKTETVVVGTVDKVEFNVDDIKAGDGQLVRNAVTNADVKPDAKKLHWYRVTRGGNIGHDGVRTRLTVGKELHDGAYDIRNLIRQGIALEDLGEGPATGPLQSAPQATA